MGGWNFPIETFFRSRSIFISIVIGGERAVHLAGRSPVAGEVKKLTRMSRAHTRARRAVKGEGDSKKRDGDRRVSIQQVRCSRCRRSLAACMLVHDPVARHPAHSRGATSGSVPSRSSPSVRAHRCARARVARVVRVRSVDEAEDVNAEADKDAEADERTFAPDVEGHREGRAREGAPGGGTRGSRSPCAASPRARSRIPTPDALTAKRAASHRGGPGGGHRRVPQTSRRPPRVRRRSARPPPRLRPLRAQTQRHRGGETPGRPPRAPYRGLRDLISRAMVVLVGGWGVRGAPERVAGDRVVGHGRWGVGD